LKDLGNQRDRIDEAIKGQGAVLSACFPEDTTDIMNKPLVDNDGFPFTDMNQPLITETRRRIRELQNDRKELCTKMEDLMLKFHSAVRESRGENEIIEHSTPSQHKNKVPFLIVKSVSPGSPAASAGFLLGDKITKLDKIDSENFIGMNQIVNLIRNSENKSLTVAIERTDCINLTSLVPKTWSGPGLLGCVIDSIK